MSQLNSEVPATSQVTSLGIGCLRPRARRGAALYLPILILGCFLATFNSVRVTGAVMFSDAFFLVAACLLVLEAMRGGQGLWIPWWFWGGSSVMLLPELVNQLGFDEAPSASLAPTGVIWFCWLFTPILIANVARDPRHFSWLCMAWIGACLLAAILAVLGAYGIKLPGIQFNEGARLAGYVTGPNGLARISAGALPAFTALLFISKSVRFQIVGISVLVVSLYAINETGSRKELISLFGSMIILVIVWLGGSSRRSLVPRLSMLFVGACVIGIAATLSVDGSQSAITRLIGFNPTAAASDLKREWLTELAWNDFWSNPFFGVGYEKYIGAHNTWLSMLRCGGVFGLLLLIIRDVGIVLQLRSGFRFVHTRAELLFLLGLALNYGAWLLSSVKSVPGADRFTPIGIGLALAMTLQLCDRAATMKRACDARL